MTTTTKAMATYTSAKYISTQYSYYIDGWLLDGSSTVIRTDRKTGLKTTINSVELNTPKVSIAPNLAKGIPILINTGCKFYSWISKPVKYRPCYLNTITTGGGRNITITDALTGAVIGYAMPVLASLGTIAWNGECGLGFKPADWNSIIQSIANNLSALIPEQITFLYTPSSATLKAALPKYKQWVSVSHATSSLVFQTRVDGSGTNTTVNTMDVYDMLTNRDPFKVSFVLGCNVLRDIGKDFWSHVLTKDILGNVVIGPTVAFDGMQWHSDLEKWITNLFSYIGNNRTYAQAMDEAGSLVPSVGIQMGIYEGTRPLGSPNLERPVIAYDISMGKWDGGSVQRGDIDLDTWFQKINYYSYQPSPYGNTITSGIPGNWCRLKAVPFPGYRFYGWQGDIAPQFSRQPIISIKVMGACSVKPVFTPIHGDINKTGTLDGGTAAINNIILGRPSTDDQRLRADTNNDGRVSTGDIIVLERQILGLTDVVPADAPYMYRIGDTIQLRNSTNTALFQITNLDTAAHTVNGVGLYTVKVVKAGVGYAMGTVSQVDFSQMVNYYKVAVMNTAPFMVGDFVKDKTGAEVWILAFDAKLSSPGFVFTDVITQGSLTGVTLSGTKVLTYAELAAGYTKTKYMDLDDMTRQ